MRENHGRSVGPKGLMTILHALGVAGAAWLLLGGLDDLANWAGTELPSAGLPRRSMLIGMSIIYFSRLLVTAFLMVKRRFSYGEALIVGVWTIIIHTTMAILGGTNAEAVGPVAWLGLVLYVIGSYLNTGSEYQRLRWKQVPEHTGKLYTEGLFRYAMHINYFGDVVLFTGFALATGRAWSLVIPTIMAALFVFLNIPELDRYLAGRYGEAFENYAATTAKLVPYIY